MHPISNCARSSATRRTWQRRVTECLFCLGCLAAGATLVALAVPTSSPLSAGASVGQAMPQVGLLDFTATWCPPCQQMSPIVEGLQRQGYPVYKVDADQRPDLMKKYKISGMPTFLLIVDGKEVMRQTGATSESQLRRMLLQIPEYQQLAQQNQPKSRPAKPDPIASADPEFGPSPNGVELGEPKPVVPKQFAANDPPSKPKFNLNPFHRNTAPEVSPPRNLDDATVRLQSPDTDPMQASTRLRVKDKTGVNYGSGTIIYSTRGRTLILTCGHIFRGMDPSGTVEVDVFDRNKQPQTHAGKVLHYDLEADVGVVAIGTQHALPTIPLASLNRPVVKGEAVLNIGCSNGDLPTRENLSVTALNFYEGPDSLQCSGFPVPGRSGGGLFRNNELVGVCIAADPTDKRGVYTGLAPIYDLLEKAGCGQVLPVGQPAQAPTVVATPKASSQSAPKTEAAPANDDVNASLAAAAMAAGVTDSQAAEDLHAAFANSTDAEVICIVRPRDPRTPSRTVIIHQASPKLVGYLLDSVEAPAVPASPPNVLAQTDALIPTAQQRIIDTPAVWPRTLTEPTRPVSPRGLK